MKALQDLGLSERAACRLVGCPRRTIQYRSQRPDRDQEIRGVLRELAEKRPRFDWRRLRILLRRRHLRPNHKRLRRIYREECLQVRPRKKRRVRFVRGTATLPVTRPNEEWGLDFMEDRLFNRRKIRVMTLEDRFSREGLALEPAFSSRGNGLFANSTRSPPFAVTRRVCELITVPSSRVALFLRGPSSMKSIFTSSTPASPRRMPGSNHSTPESGMSFSTSAYFKAPPKYTEQLKTG